MPLRSEIQAAPSHAKARNRTSESAWDLISDLAENPDFLAICAFTIVGLFVSLCLAMFFPLIAESVALLGVYS